MVRLLSQAAPWGGRKPRGDLRRARSRRNPEAGAWRSGSRRALGCPAESDSTMALEQGLGSSSPPCSQLLDAMLQNLYDFGQAEGEAKRKRIRKKRENKQRDLEIPVASGAELAPQPGSPVRGQRRNASAFFLELREELQGAPASTPTGAPAGPQVPCGAIAPSSLDNRERVQVVEFHSRSKKRKQKPDQDENTKTRTGILEKDVNTQEFNLEKARLEVHRFGITGYGKGKERVLERERAVMLGAQPPKKSYVNYKVLQEQIKEKKAAEEEERRMARDTDIFKKRRKGQEDRKSKKKKSAPSILSNGRIGQVGKFKNGTLILSQVDIRKINSSRVAK
ncbi:uncharacterized protein C1orf131 homolog [Sturnira hondurensis]|uniref:uncharacterized protein C1orf131 homolog n=1 Tax=Sturnira hondurensis TaxID=192404 RepID=UPI001879F9DC|nr:uncharacterized protein C1orf131 homolog [Sturnira hondurensis]